MADSGAPVLIVEDERIVARDLQRTLLGFGYDAFAIAASCEEAMARAAEKCPAVVLMDIRIKGAVDGIATARMLRDRFATVVVYLTSHADADTLQRATATEPSGYLQKPVRPAELRSAIEISLHKRKAEARWRDGARWIESALDAIEDAVIAVDPDGKILELNPVGASWLGQSVAALRGVVVADVLRFVDPSTGLTVSEPTAVVRTEGLEQRGRARVHSPDSSVRFARYRAQPVLAVGGGPVLGAVLVMSEEAPDRQPADTDRAFHALIAAERELRASLREKDVLLKEVHHRVKNNLQVISSLLSLQAMQLLDPDIRDRLLESQHRVQAIALVHEKLYRSEHLSHIRFGEYTEALATDLAQTHAAAARGIALSLHMDDVCIGVDTAIPCGLILNELVSNALKHAFVGSPSGTVEVRLVRADRRLTLSVADDGIGLPSDLDPRRSSSLGLDLVFTFAEQLDADVEVETEVGTRFSISFAEK